jgi:hypothetical protein
MRIVVTHGIKKTADLLAQETSKAKKIDWGMTKSFYIDAGIEETCREAVKRGVDERLLGEVTGKTLAIARKYQSLGVKVKNIPLADFKFGLRDYVFSRFWIGQGEAVFCVWIYDKKTTSQFRKMYQRLWEMAKDIKPK